MKKLFAAVSVLVIGVIAVGVPLFIEKGKTIQQADEARHWRDLAESILQNRPYFGAAMAAGQARPERMRHFPATVAAVRGDGNISVLEIGSWAGQSTVAWAQAIDATGLDGSVVCIDPWVPYFDEKVNDAAWYREMNRAAENSSIYNLFQHNIASSGFAAVIEPRIGTTAEIAPTLPPGSFDLVFVDGSHLYQDVVVDLREAARLVRDGGLICGDDLERQAADLDPDSLRVATESGQDTVDGFHPGVTRAVSEAFGPVSVHDGFWCAKKEGGVWKPANLYPQ